ncbi:GntR family transcriptional regulator [Paenibacillus qinlingensis]|uniref:GntR family transcriptional regulator n=1 Tax=Paenibacillus qinlingensis TaxID=1837343 RepID=A0ABU1P514_9BACL|nr:GntR family transcriptional regulator [Paenibacillus qinlingensis]MDR6554845.1 GntR family transcriptional regulator [Paenibacillus qinlingensis]
MDEKKLPLRVAPDLAFNVNTQIKEQLKWLIGIGHIEPGDMLPSTSQLADELGLNLNTINNAFTQLRYEGLVTMQRGRGTQVVDGIQTERLRKERLSMQKLLEKTICEAVSAGHDLQQLFTASLAYVLLSTPRTQEKLHIVLVECREHDHQFLSEAIAQATDCTVSLLFLEDPYPNGEESDEILRHANFIITTLIHEDEVKSRFACYDKKIVVIGTTVDTSCLLQISRLESDTNVTFVCLGKTGGEWMANQVRDAGIDHIHFGTLGWNDRERLPSVLQQSDIIYASSSVFPELKKLASEKVELFPIRLEKTSKSLLDEISKQSIRR